VQAEIFAKVHSQLEATFHASESSPAGFHPTAANTAIHDITALQSLLVTFSMPSVLGPGGIVQILEPEMSKDEGQALERGAETLRKAASRITQRARSSTAQS
jgi:malate/lactate dehydrogenase